MSDFVWLRVLLVFNVCFVLVVGDFSRGLYSCPNLVFYFGAPKSIGLSLKGVNVSRTKVSYYLSEISFRYVLIENFDNI